MAKKNKLSEERRKENILNNSIAEKRKAIANNILPLNPTRKFIVGQRINLGAHKEVYIREVFDDGLFYKIESIAVKRSRDKPSENESHVIAWNDMYHYNSEKPTKLMKKKNYYINNLNSSLSSLLNMVYHAGVDFDVEYQREHVWKKTDKIALIDSIFNSVDIGKFVFIQRSFHFIGKLYEILDGKQRLSAIIEFYEDRFKYNGYYFSELSNYDKMCFENHPISYGYLDNPNKKTIFDAFIRLNTSGKSMSSKQINKVKKLLENESV